jgi:RHS repeat-associated protein
VLINGEVVEAYAYDGSGRLTALFQGTVSTPSEIILHDGENMVASFSASGVPNWQAAWGPGTDRLIELRNSTGNHIPLGDHRNSIAATWVPGPNGGISGTAEYNPEGRSLRRGPDGAEACREAGGTICRPPGGLPFGFVTAWRSFTSGLLYMRQRWYSPELGEFLSHDPAGPSGNGNPYAYSAFDPINNWDPSGLNPRGFTRDLDNLGSQRQETLPQIETSGTSKPEPSQQRTPLSDGPRISAALGPPSSEDIIWPRRLTEGPAVQYEGQLWSDRMLRRENWRIQQLRAGAAIASSPLSAIGFISTNNPDEQLNRAELGAAIWNFASGLVGIRTQRQSAEAASRWGQTLPPAEHYAPTMPPFALGELKSWKSTRAGLQQLSSRGYVAGNTALITYDYSGNIYAQVFQKLGNTSYIVWEGSIGRVKPLPSARPGTPAFGNQMEPLVKSILEQATGIRFQDKHPNTTGPDYLPAPPLR